MVVELESPTAKLLNPSDGDPSKKLTHAIRQIQDWRAWLTPNQGYADRPRKEQGLGLRNIDNHVPGLILIGRRSSDLALSNARRRQYRQSLNIQIHTYGWLVETAHQGAPLED